jgi:hypothetical protein
VHLDDRCGVEQRLKRHQGTPQDGSDTCQSKTTLLRIVILP